MHPTSKGKMAIAQPDDIANLGHNIVVGFQNFVGPQGEPASGNSDSTIVEFSSSGSKLAQWDIAGHVDGLATNPATGQIVATTNEDANAHLYVITPSKPQAVSYHVPPLPSKGGFDAVSFYKGLMLVSASAPGTNGKAPPQANYPAVYVVTLNSSTHTASVRELFGDEASAKRANSGAATTTQLALTDPDSNAVVPAYAQRFAGQFMLDSQGDYEQVYLAGTSGQQLSVLKSSQSLDDIAWASGPSGTLYVTEGGGDLIFKITGSFKAGSELAGVTPCDAGNAPASCPAPGFSNPYLGEVNQSTGAVTRFAGGGSIQPSGLLFLP